MSDGKKTEDNAESIMYCPRCGSTTVETARFTKLKNPLAIQSLYGWDCHDCMYRGKDFKIVSKVEYDKIRVKFDAEKAKKEKEIADVKKKKAKKKLDKQKSA